MTLQQEHRAVLVSVKACGVETPACHGELIQAGWASQGLGEVGDSTAGRSLFLCWSPRARATSLWATAVLVCGLSFARHRSSTRKAPWGEDLNSRPWPPLLPATQQSQRPSKTSCAHSMARCSERGAHLGLPGPDLILPPLCALPVSLPAQYTSLLCRAIWERNQVSMGHPELLHRRIITVPKKYGAKATRSTKAWVASAGLAGHCFAATGNWPLKGPSCFLEEERGALSFVWRLGCPLGSLSRPASS